MRVDFPGSVVFETPLSVDGAVLWDLFSKVEWIRPRSEKPERHRRIDGIANHTIHLDGPHEAEFLAEAFRNSRRIVTARAEGRIVGVVRVVSDGIQRSVIYDLVVDPAWQGRGIGRALVERCITEFGHTQITLGTSSKTTAFYERLGFESSGSYMERPTEDW